MKKLLLLTGDLACGKTTFSKILSKRYGVEAYNKDSIKEILGDTIGFKNREENLKLSHATIAVMTHIFEKNAACGHDLILEANFHDGEIEKLCEIADNNGFTVLTLNFFADTETLYRRFRYRIENENRHPVHQTAGLVDQTAFCDYLEKSRGRLPENRIDINADNFDYQTDESLLGKIDGFMKPSEKTGTKTI